MIATINGNDFNVNDGWNIIERRNEQFDEGFIEIHSTIKTPFNSWSYVVLNENETYYYYYISADDVEEIDKLNNVYKHNISLIELTAILKQYSMPVKRFTSRFDGGVWYNSMRDMNDILWSVAFTELEDSQAQYEYESSTSTLLNDTQITDTITISEGNLWTSMKYLFNELNGVPRITKLNDQNKPIIKIDLLNQIDNTIQIEKYDSYKSTNSIENYGTMYETRGLNVTNDARDSNDITISYTRNAFVSVRSQAVMMDEQDMKFDTYYKNNGVKQVNSYIYSSATEVEITDFVFSKEVWDTLDTDGFTSGTTDAYKQNSVYYIVGDREILGWQETFDGIIADKVVWEELHISALTKAALDTANKPGAYTDFAIQTQFTAIIENCIIRSPKEDITNVNQSTTFLTNQSANLPSLKELGKIMHSDCQRGGNRVTTYTSLKNDDITTLYNINDYDELTNSIITIKKTVGYERNYIVTYELHEDFQKITEQIDIAAQLRQYPITEKGKSVESPRYYEDFIIWNFKDQENNSSSVTSVGVNSFMHTFGRTFGFGDNKEVDNVIITDGTLTDDLIIPVISNGYRNTMQFYFGFDDNYVAGNKVLVNNSQQGVRYKDSNGFLEYATLDYGKNLDTTNKLVSDTLPKLTSDVIGESLIKFGESTTEEKTIVLNPIISTSQFSEDVQGSKTTVNNLDGSLLTELGFNVTRISGTSDVTINDLYVDISYTTATTTGNISNVQLTVGQSTIVSINADVLTLTYTFNWDFEQTLGDTTKYLLTADGVQEIITSGTGIKLNWDISEVGSLSYFLHNVPLNDELGEVIIGDQTTLANSLIGGNIKTSSELFVYITTDRYSRFEKQQAKGTIIGNAITYLTTNPQSLELSNYTLSVNESWALGDNTGKLYFAINPPINGTAQSKVSFDFRHYRTGLIRHY